MDFIDKISLLRASITDRIGGKKHSLVRFLFHYKKQVSIIPPLINAGCKALLKSYFELPWLYAEWVCHTQWHSSAPQRQWSFEMDAAGVTATEVKTASETETQFKEYSLGQTGLCFSHLLTHMCSTGSGKSLQIQKS